MPWVNRPPQAGGLKGRESLSRELSEFGEISPGLSGRGVDCLSTQGIGLRPQPWAGISRPVGPVGIYIRAIPNATSDLSTQDEDQV